MTSKTSHTAFLPVKSRVAPSTDPPPPRHAHLQKGAQRQDETCGTLQIGACPHLQFDAHWHLRDDAHLHQYNDARCTCRMMREEWDDAHLQNYTRGGADVRHSTLAQLATRACHRGQ
eukprot:1152880-Pelagomonas_calceolata.AAC.2